MVKRNYRDAVLKKIYNQLNVLRREAKVEALKNNSAAKENKVRKADRSISDISRASLQVSTEQAKGPDKTSESGGEFTTKLSETTPEEVIQEQPSGMLIVFK